MASDKANSSAAVDAREIAARVLTRVLRDRAYASASLDAEIAKHPQLAVRDRALATELVYGTLRTHTSLRNELGRFAKRGLPEGDVAFMVPLEMAAYQILFLDRVPAFAAVDAAVGQISQRRGKQMAGFANAVLRKLRRGTAVRHDAVYESVPPWLRVRMEHAVGKDAARALVGAGDDDSGTQLSALGLRVKQGETLSDEVVGAEPSPWVVGAYRLSKAGDPRKLASYRAGNFSVQEEGAQFVAFSLGAKPGERIWDACAGRGQKSTLLAERVNPGDLWASDLYQSKLDALAADALRLHLPAIHTRALDLTQGTADLPQDFDRVLVDAPCSGTGTLRRRPEILLRLEPEDPKRLGELAERILRMATRRVRLGGRVVFAVCSVLTEECEAVVDRVSDILVPTAFDSEPVLQAFGSGVTRFRLLPGIHGTDGYFAASLCRIA